jgi:hypothetical protein
MPQVWFKKNPDLLVKLREQVEAKYPDLRIQVVDEFVTINGSFPIIEDGVELDRYQIKIIIPPDFPREIPIAKETAGRIPWTADWHTFDKGFLCVIVPEEWLLNSNAHSLMHYFDGPLRNYLIGNSLAETNAPRPMGERPHGSKGLLESYGEMVEWADSRAVPAFLDAVAAKRVRQHLKCPCGSGSMIRDCHLPKVQELRNRIPRWIAAKARKRIGDQRLMEAKRRQEEATSATK